MKRMTYWNEERQRYEINDACMIHAGSITDRLAHFENLQTECIELTGYGLEMLATKYAEFLDDIARLHAFDSIGLTPEEIKDILSVLSENQDDVDEDGISTGMIHDLLKLARYRQAEEQGLLIKQPFPQHSFVYYIDDEQNIKQGKYLTTLKCDRNITHALYQGKDPYTYFLVDEVYGTREAAELALKGGEGE